MQNRYTPGHEGDMNYLQNWVPPRKVAPPGGLYQPSYNQASNPVSMAPASGEGAYGAWPGNAPAYQRAYDPLSMSLFSKMQTLLSGVQPDQRGINAFRDQALRSGPSAWATTEMDRQNLEESSARQRLGREAAGRTAEGESALAMRGGLTGGARERLREGATRDYLDMSQNVGRQAGLNRLQIQSQDEQNRIGQLGQLPGMENQLFQGQLDKTKLLGQVQGLDTAAVIAENQRKNDYNKGTWEKQMEAWGASRTAQATENAGKK